MRLSYILHIVFLFLSSAIRAQQINVGFNRFTTANGLSDNNTNALLQDSRGFIWVGSSNGLNRFDGHFFKRYRLMGKDGLTDLSIVCLAEDDEGNIWIGTTNGLNRLNPFTEKITQYTQGDGPGRIPYAWCNYLYIDHEKKLWLSTEKGLALYNPKENSFQNFPVEVFGKDSRINKFISTIMEDSKGRFWLATSYGIKLFDRRSRTYKTYLYEEAGNKELASYPIMSMTEDKTGGIWAGTWGGGLLKLDETDQQFKKQKGGEPDFSRYIISGLSGVELQSAAYMLLSTNNGLLFMPNNDPSVVLPSALKENVNALLKDRQGNLWVSSSTGLYEMNMNSQAFRWIELPGVDKLEPAVFHIIPGSSDPGTEFFLTTVKGWWKYDAVTQKISPVHLPPDPANLLSGINDWYADKNGYWFTSVRGLGFYDLKKNQVEDMSKLVLAFSGQPSTDLIISDRQKRLWITMRRSGILLYDPAQKKAIGLFNDRSMAGNTVGKDIHDLKEGPDGYIYFTLANGLYKVNTNDLSYTIITSPGSDDGIDENKISPDKMIITGKGRFIVTSKRRIYELKNNRLSQIYPAKGYADFTIDKIYCSPNGNIWIITPNGVFRTHDSFREWIRIDDRLGWPEDESVNELYPREKGELLFAGNGKMGILYDSLLSETKPPPQVIISRVKFGVHEKYLVTSNTSGIRCSYKDPVEIELASNNFVNEKENRVFYQLEGWDNDWKELSGQSFIRYEQLPPGRYVFNTRQVNAGGVAGMTSSFTFEIAPPFYQSWWFIVLLILVTALLVYIIYRSRLKKAVEMERLRTRIATDLHDDIGATLSSISMYSDAVKQQVKEKLPHLVPVMDKIGENSRDMVTSMSDIVWAINPDNDDGSKLIERIGNHAQDLCSAKDIRLTYTTDPAINNLVLPLEIRKNIYLVFKEALNNALKYASPSNIQIGLRINNRRLELQIRDDGKGFDQQAVVTGNGLKNMTERANEINGTMEIGSTPGAGTSVTFSCPFHS